MTTDWFDQAILPNVLPVSIAMFFLVLISVVAGVFGFEVQYKLYSVMMLIIGFSSLFLGLLAACLWTLWVHRPTRPTLFLAKRIRNEWRASERIIRGIPILAVYPIFFGAFTSYKSALGQIVPFYFDPHARRLDYILHGRDAWKLLEPITNYAFLTSAINFIYHLWFLLLYATLFFVAFIVTDLRYRSQFLIAFTLCWFVIGIVFATAFSSVGPCYYKHFYNDGHYQYIADYLQSAQQHYPVPALTAQQFLLENFNARRPGMGNGISAAPSMHVSIAALIALFVSRYGNAAAFVGWSYCALIFVGSVHLGWHYAIDGYLALMLTGLIWKAAERIVVLGRLKDKWDQAL